MFILTRMRNWKKAGGKRVCGNTKARKKKEGFEQLALNCLNNLSLPPTSWGEREWGWGKHKKIQLKSISSTRKYAILIVKLKVRL